MFYVMKAIISCCLGFVWFLQRIQSIGFLHFHLVQSSLKFYFGGFMHLKVIFQFLMNHIMVFFSYTPSIKFISILWKHHGRNLQYSKCLLRLNAKSTTNLKLTTKAIWKPTLGKKNLTSSTFSYSRLRILTESKSYSSLVLWKLKQ